MVESLQKIMNIFVSYRLKPKILTNKEALINRLFGLVLGGHEIDEEKIEKISYTK